jgi:hypothetical protein
MKRWALLSPCQTYRYILGREEDDQLFPAADRTLLFVLNNPSTATADVDDQTSKKCWKYARLWDYRRMLFVNTNPWRSTDPKSAQMPPEAILAANDAHVREAAAAAALIVCAWGGSARHILVHRAIKALSDKPLHYLELSKKGTPKHPLYLPGNLQPQPWVMK